MYHYFEANYGDLCQKLDPELKRWLVRTEDYNISFVFYVDSKIQKLEREREELDEKGRRPLSKEGRRQLKRDRRRNAQRTVQLRELLAGVRKKRYRSIDDSWWDCTASPTWEKV